MLKYLYETSLKITIYIKLNYDIISTLITNISALKQ